MPLDPELARYLDEQKNAPPRSSLTIEQTREMMLGNHKLSEKSPPLPKVEDLEIAGCRARQYWPADDADLPITVFFHGGRFISGGVESHDSMCRFLALFAGARILSVEYRLAPENPFPAAALDALAALQQAGNMASVVAVAGDSAGACLAAVAALQQPSVVAQVLLYPMLDPACRCDSHREFATGYGPGTNDMMRGWKAYAPDPADLRSTPLAWGDLRRSPPALVITCEYDCLRDEGELYAARLRDAGALVTLHRFDGAIHGFAGMTEFSQAGRCALVEAGEYLHQRFREARG